MLFKHRFIDGFSSKFTYINNTIIVHFAKLFTMRWLRYIAIVITPGDWFQTEYSVYTEHRKSNRIEIAILIFRSKSN